MILTSLLHGFRPLRRCERGVSAVEFALLAPVLVTATLMTVDAGMAVYEKMKITQVLRAGASAAITASTEAEVLTILNETAADNFTVVAQDPEPGELAMGVDRYCICPENTGTPVACDTVCTAGPPDRFYELSADFLFSGVILPDFSLDGEISVLSP